jgi:hypothetical protein
LAFELNRAKADAGIHPANWEKKGSSLYTKKNVEKYRELRSATYRLFNRIKADGGFVIYVGIEKHLSVELSSPKGLYKQVMHEMIKRLDSECEARKSKFMIMLDQQDDMQECGKDKGLRYEIVKGAAQSMFGADGRKNLIEPPVQAESHLYQTLQCADWICGLVGRLTRYEVESQHFPDHKIFETYFSDRLRQVARRSSIRKKAIIPTPQSVVTK